MILQPKISARERILIYGGPGVGKSTAHLSLSRSITGRVYVIDTDYAMDRMVGEGGYENVEVAVATDWTEMIGAFRDFTSRATADDWIVVDMLSNAWDYVQEWYVEQIFGKTADRFFLEARSAQKKGNALDGFKDWSVINKSYRAFTNMILKVNQTCHVLATASAAAVSNDLDDKDVKALFGPLGVRPVGQKQTGHLFHTVLLGNVTRTGDYTLTTVKDRERAKLDKAPYSGDFGKDYLMKVAGWRPGGKAVAA